MAYSSLVADTEMGWESEVQFSDGMGSGTIMWWDGMVLGE